MSKNAWKASVCRPEKQSTMSKKAMQAQKDLQLALFLPKLGWYSLLPSQSLLNCLKATPARPSRAIQPMKNIARISNLTDAERFQHELDNIVYPWAPENNMTLNGDKFEHHRIGKNLDIEKYSYKNPIEENIIEKEYIKDLGVYISSDLT